MSDAILGRLAGLPDMGADAILTVLATAIDAAGHVHEWTGDQVARLGELEQRLADLARTVRDANEGK
jgi:hypothetical protein